MQFIYAHSAIEYTLQSFVMARFSDFHWAPAVLSVLELQTNLVTHPLAGRLPRNNGRGKLVASQLQKNNPDTPSQ